MYQGLDRRHQRFSEVYLPNSSSSKCIVSQRLHMYSRTWSVRKRGKQRFHPTEKSVPGRSFRRSRQAPGQRPLTKWVKTGAYFSGETLRWSGVSSVSSSRQVENWSAMMSEETPKPTSEHLPSGVRFKLFDFKQTAFYVHAYASITNVSAFDPFVLERHTYTHTNTLHD